MSHSLLIAGLVLTGLPAFPQVKGAIRYKDAVFSAVAVKKNLSYSRADPVATHRFDWYEPQRDSTSRRPLVIWMHGGGFRFGSKHMKSIRIWCDFFARRGYVCAAINYQLGKKNLSFRFDDLVKNCYRALGDVRLAIAWFKANAIRLRIDTSRIILAGNSAGGMLALQATYGTDAGLLQLMHNPDSANASHRVDPGQIAAVINFGAASLIPPGCETRGCRSCRSMVRKIRSCPTAINRFLCMAAAIFSALPVRLASRPG
ncbi:MAG TPA: alpha/beta hydrolase [Puia sp.]|nr:alpha/beta hydrolase [Puia sp.]